MINTYYFIDEILKMGFEINLQSHNIIHANSIFSIIPMYPDFGIETSYNNKILKEMATIYARLLKQNSFKYPIIFLACLYKIKEEDQRCDETEFFIIFNFNQNLTESDIDNDDVKSQLEHQIQIQETKEIGWIFDKYNSRKIRLSKTGDLNGSSYVNLPLRSSALINIRNDDQFCFIWSILASLRPSNDDQPNRVFNYWLYSNELNIEGFDFSNGFNCSDMHKFDKINILSINIFVLNF